VDAETARRAGVPFVALLTGVTPRVAFSNYPAHAILEDLDPLPDWLSAGCATNEPRG
jgi:phosphoglycolate phosphatase-like HAD superfamily hydrolase